MIKPWVVAVSIILGVPGGILLLSFIGIAVIAQLEFPAKAAEIESLRADVVRVGPPSSEDVVGQVTAWNQRIAAQKAMNRIPVVCLTVPNGWDDIVPIVIPGQP